MPVVRRILRDAEKDNYRFSSIVQGIVNSAPFRLRMASREEADEARLSAVQ
jgi:hypothetical protein